MQNKMKLESQKQVDELLNVYNSHQQTLTVLSESLKENYLKITQSIDQYIEEKEDKENTPESLNELAKKVGIDEIHIINKEGKIASSNVKEFIGYDMNKSEQSSVFLKGITDPSFALAQDPMPRGANGQLFMYVGVGMKKTPGVVQIGVSPEQYEHVLNSINLHSLAKQKTFEQSGFSFILDPKGNILSYQNEKLIGKSSNVLPFHQKITKKQGQFSFKLDGKHVFISYKENQDGCIFGTVVNEIDYFNSLKELSFQFMIMGTLLIVLTASIFFYFSHRNIERPIQDILQSMKRIADGDLSYNLEMKNKHDEIGKIAIQYNVMRKSLHQLIEQIMKNSTKVSAVSNELMLSSGEVSSATEFITKEIQKVSEGIETQTSEMIKAAHSTEHMSLQIHDIAKATNEVLDFSTETTKNSMNGHHAIKKVIEQIEQISTSSEKSYGAIKKLNEKSKEIGAIVELITNISEQTNLLGLNASIEAARAGEYGKGFKVVADEVKKLAEESKKSANQITDIIKEIQQETDKTVHQIEKGFHEVKESKEVAFSTEVLFEKIASSIQVMEQNINQIASSTMEISSHTDQINAISDHNASVIKDTSMNAQSIASTTEEQSSAMMQVFRSSEELMVMSKELNELISKFKL